MHRWQLDHCPGCIKMCEGKPGSTSPAAREGTRAHSRFESQLSIHFPYLPLVEEEEDLKLQPSSVRAVDRAVDMVKESGIEILSLETMVHLNDDVYGTADVIGYAPDSHTLVVMDYKNGTVPVSAVDNPQLMCYAWGSYLKYRMILPIEDVLVCILQPNARNGKTYTQDALSLVQLFDFAVYVEMSVTATKQTNAVRRVGSWCEYCVGCTDCPEFLLHEKEKKQAHIDDKTIQAMENIYQLYRK